MRLLDPVDQDGPVLFTEHVRANLDDEIGPDAEEVRVERSVVELAERQPVGDDRVTPWMAIPQDASGVEPLLVTKPADGTPARTGAQHARTKLVRMHALLHGSRHVAPNGVGAGFRHDPRTMNGAPGLDLDQELEALTIVVHDVDRPFRGVPPLLDSEQVEEGDVALHRLANPHVVPVIRIGPSVAVVDDPRVLDPIGVRRGAALDRGSRAKAERNLGEDGGFEDPLLSSEVNRASLEVESAPHHRGRKDVSVDPGRAFEELEGREPDPEVEVGFFRGRGPRPERREAPERIVRPEGAPPPGLPPSPSRLVPDARLVPVEGSVGSAEETLPP